MLQVFDLQTEYINNPMGLDTKTPRLGWKLKADRKNVMQQAYQVQASVNESFIDVVWDSGKVESDQSQRIIYDGPELQSMERIYWRVKVWSHHEESEYSQPAFFETGLFEVSDWKAKWIEPEGEIDLDAYKPAPYIRKEFSVKKGLVSARAYMTAKGLYHFYINGTEGTDDLFNPGFTSYNKRLQYQAYDITNLTQEGQNAIGIILGDGWWRGSNGAMGTKNCFGYKLAFLGQIVLKYEDGSQEIIASDDSFKTSYGPILKSDLKAGELFDARIEIDGWNKPNFDDASWRPVTISDNGYEQLIATRSVPVRCKEQFAPEILITPNGETVLDFGQNIAGWVEMKVQGVAGTEVVLIHGETLDREGNFTLSNLSLPWNGEEHFQEVHYFIKGSGIERYRPHFAIFGFRYVLLKNYPGEVKAENFTAVAVYSEMEETGDFTCSNPLINQLVTNARWSQKGNFLEIPIDCPTRERAGWTGDAQLYSRTATDFMNVYTFFEKWMADVAAEQFANGCIGNTVPNGFAHNKEERERISSQNTDPLIASLGLEEKPGEASILDGSSGWGDAAVIIPWTMYLCYGDKNILKQQYQSAKAWVNYMDACTKTANEHYKDTPAYHTYSDGELDATFIWDTKFHWGEWLEPDFSEMTSVEAINEFFTNRLTLSDPLVSTAYYAYSTRLLSEMAAILGRKEDEDKYSKLYKKIKKVYNQYFIPDNGIILNDRQAPNVRTLAFDLVYEDKKQAVADRLAEIVKEKDYHLNTGFLSTPFILHVLADNGYKDMAFRLLEQDTCPSWLYAVTKGATTIWENWDSVTPDGDLTGSLNHYSYGAVCDFLFTGVAGIRPVFEKPGYKHFLIKPLQGGTLTHASAKYESLYGTIESSWEMTDKGVSYQFVVPANTTATVMLPGNQNDLESLVTAFKDATYYDGRIVFEVGSGEYNVTL
ncbi:glycoside hydrolase family 78 protein [Paenibacillus albidus]|uniref:glycoside hydrolase family 78 protein n=1 Tax=Paenibacillus albidus TaxID=2041023 RepID=UPI001BECF8B0|nr:glycoside hydrolase family 78 protein [Paenibacillus albidus]MBT2293136.1 glycoside hydrolase family 78 protein [Paenibacillus albidus]